jgi:hypothetical protein
MSMSDQGRFSLSARNFLNDRYWPFGLAPAMHLSVSPPLIGRHCQAPALRLLLQIVSGVGHAPFRSRFNNRCTHRFDGMESLALDRA